VSSIADPRVVARLVARLENLRPDTPRRWGTLAPGEMLCHLGDSATSVLAMDAPEASNRPFRRWIGLRSPLPWPKGARAPTHVDPRAGGTRPGDFERDRRRAIDALRALSTAPDAAFKRSHALFGRMHARDWRRWAVRHTDHHMRQFGL
jgi:hypothetical protein